MPSISPRQKQILYYLSLEQIENYEPVASNQIKEKYNLEFSSATIRNELFQLCQMAYLEQPHTSSGRILSDFGWETLITHFLETIFEENQLILPNDFNLLVKKLSDYTSSFAFLYDFVENKIFNNGFAFLLNEKTITNLQELSIIAKTIDKLDEKILSIAYKIKPNKINVFIGKKNQLFKTDNISFIAIKSIKNNFIIGIITPKITNYKKHFKIFKSLINQI